MLSCSGAGVLTRSSLINAHWCTDISPEIDHTFPTELRRRAEDILVEKKHDYFFQVFGGVAHGFAVRGDPNIPIQRKSEARYASFRS